MKKRKRSRRKERKKFFQKNLILIFVLICVAFFIGYKIKIPEISVPEGLVLLPQLSTIGYIKVEPSAFLEAERGVIVLKDECWRLTAYTTKDQALSIALGIEKKIEFRPLTHDLIKEVFDFFGIEILMVKIFDIRNNTFIAKTILRRGNKILSLDSRPSDGIAIAVRYDAPIYIKKELMEEYGRKVC